VRRSNRTERRPIWTQVARYALGRYDEIDEDAIREICEFIAARKDCADFVIQGLLRPMIWDRDNGRLSSAIRKTDSTWVTMASMQGANWCVILPPMVRAKIPG
jgi:hypothetical protein